SGQDFHLTCTHAAQGLGHQWLAAARHVFGWYGAQNVQFRPKLLQQGFIDGRGLFTVRPHIQGGADHLGERNEVLERALNRRGSLFRAVCQALDPVQHPYCQLAAAHRTAPISLQGLRWLPAYLTLAVTIVVVLAFLWVEF